VDVTLLGTGDATSVPAPLCDCEYCVESDRRRHPAVLVETDATTLLLDAGPDLQEQLAETGVRSADAVFLTHAHGDHSAGLPGLAQTAKWDADHLDAVDELAPTAEEFDPGYPVYLTDTAREHLGERDYDLGARLRLEPVDDGETETVGDATVTAVPVEHHRPTFRTLGFLVEAGGATLLYAPDVRSWVDGPPDADVDLLVCEGAAVLGQPVHGPADELRSAIDGVGADRTVLVNVNEHLQRSHTDELAGRAAEQGYELGSDFATFAL
jgi:phosphoribosyl 1,2-cyclic phosphate phosphodiesterase